MALQAGVSTSKVLILVGAGLTSSIILKNGRLSELIAQLQELLQGVKEAENFPYKYDSAILAAQIRQLAQEIKQLSSSSPITIHNGNTDSSGSFASYLVPAAALGAMGYCYMWWKGWSFSDVMFVTKQNMANAVASVSKQLENVSETLAATKRHLSKRLDSLDWKVGEQIEESKLIANEVDNMASSLSQIGFDVESIHEALSELDGKLKVLDSKQDATNAGLWYLCRVAATSEDRHDGKVCQDIYNKLANDSALTPEEMSLKGLQFIAEVEDSDTISKPIENVKKNDLDDLPGIKVKSTMKTSIHRRLSLTRSILGSAVLSSES